MFDEEKVKRDLEKMRKAHKEAMERLDDIKIRQDKIRKKIYEARQNKSS